MRVFLVYAHVSGLEDRDLYTRTPCNRLSRDNTRLLNNSIIGVEWDHLACKRYNHTHGWKSAVPVEKADHQKTTEVWWLPKIPSKFKLPSILFQEGSVKVSFAIHFCGISWHTLGHLNSLVCIYTQTYAHAYITHACTHIRTYTAPAQSRDLLCILIYMATYQYSDWVSYDTVLH